MIDENSEKAFYGSEDSEKEEEEEEEKEKEEKPKKKPYIMDPDHRLLLRTCKPLLNSRNASVSIPFTNGGGGGREGGREEGGGEGREWEGGKEETVHHGSGSQTPAPHM